MDRSLWILFLALVCLPEMNGNVDALGAKHRNVGVRSLLRSKRNVVSNLFCTNQTVLVTCSVPPNQNITEIKSKDPVPTNVQVLVLALNHFKFINKTDFNTFTELVQVLLFGNKIQWIEDYTFVNSSKLSVLNLNSNEITSINNKTFLGLSNLIELNLQNNKISYIDRSIFLPLTSLEDLYLGQNLIQQIPGCSFCDLTSLHTLDLGSNKISSIEDNALQGLDKITYLSINNNKIKSFNFTQLSFSTKNNEFYTRENDWNCTCELKKQFDEYLKKTDSMSSCGADTGLACVQCKYPVALVNVSLAGLTEQQLSDCVQVEMTTSPSTTNMVTMTEEAQTESKKEIASNMTDATTSSSIPLTSSIKPSTNMPSSSPISVYSSTVNTANTADNIKANEFDHNILIAVLASVAFVLIVIAAAWLYIKKRPSGKMSTNAHSNYAYDATSLSLADSHVLNVFDPSHGS